MKKILIYNWIPFDEKLNKGGGVTVYTRNLIKSLIDSMQYEVYFLSSGRAYNMMKPRIYIEETTNIWGMGCKSYQIVNSPVLSSAHLAFVYLKDYISDLKLKSILSDFIDKMGGFDIIHFQNLEGLPLSVLELKEKYPCTKFIYSMHNYFPFCPQVMLWKGDSRKCDNINCGVGCMECIPIDVYKWKVILNQSINYNLEKRGKTQPSTLVKWLQKQLDNFCLKRSRIRKNELLCRKEELGEIFKEFEQRNIKYLNKYMDAILVVSQRVGEIAQEKGIQQEKIHISYIGTEVAKKQREESIYRYKLGERFNICYLGYMRTMKGFYFLLDALELMDSERAKKMGVCLATKITDDKIRIRIDNLKEKFGNVRIYEGYTHEQLPMILKDVHLGIVPVLWEDNLPQVAIEMKANGIPVLASDLGGAKELSKSNDFVFSAGNVDMFLQRLADFMDGRISLDSYWYMNKRLLTMEEHVRELENVYV